MPKEPYELTCPKCGHSDDRADYLEGKTYTAFFTQAMNGEVCAEVLEDMGVSDKPRILCANCGYNLLDHPNTLIHNISD